MSDLLSQAEIDALLNGFGGDAPSGVETQAQGPDLVKMSKNDITQNNDLTDEEKDVLGEVGNISMGASATTLSTLINQEVVITTPKVTVMTWEELVSQYPRPYVIAKVEYTEGLTGSNLLIMNVADIKILTNLMMGGEVEMEEERLSELQLSAISEAMNQMIGSSCTAMASMVGKKIDITPPSANYIDFGTNDDHTAYSGISEDKNIVKISFRMVVGTLIDSEIMQLIPVSFAKSLVKSMLEGQDGGSQPVQEPTRVIQPIATKQPNIQMPETPMVNYAQQQPQQQYMAPQQQQPQQQYMAPQQMNYAQQEQVPRQPVNVQPVQFQTFEDTNYMGYKENIGLIMDVPLQVTVELGRATRMIRDILEFGPGSIVELDKLAGEPVDILVNGKIIAKGEVVVIDESFGIRITDIVHPSKRL